MERIQLTRKPAPYKPAKYPDKLASLSTPIIRQPSGVPKIDRRLPESEVVFPAVALVVVALGIGLLIYQTRIGLGPASIVGVALMLAVMPGVKADQSVGQVLRPLFGTTDQLLAALVFATVTIYLLKRKTWHWFVSIPLVLVAVTTVSAMIWNIWSYVEERNWTLTVIGSIILLAGVALIVMACGAYRRARREIEAESEPVSDG